MKFSYKLHRLCGAPYGTPSATQTAQAGGSSGGGNVLYDSAGNVLLSPVSNRIQCVDLLTHGIRTLPIESRSNVRTIALSPDDRILVVVDVEDYALVVNYRRGVVLHRFRFKDRVRAAEFSPCGRYLAVTHGRHLQVWRSPGLVRRTAPLSLQRTYTGLGGDVVSIRWSSDSSLVMGASVDSTARIWSLFGVRDYVPVTLSGHRGALVGAYFEETTGGGLRRVYTVSADGALATWRFEYDDEGGGPSGGEEEEEEEEEAAAASDSAVGFFSGGAAAPAASASAAAAAPGFPPSSSGAIRMTQARRLVRGRWSVEARHYFGQERASVTATAHSSRHSLLVVGFSSGLFGLYELPSASNVHTLSISNRYIRTVSINPTGEWLAFGCPSARQLLVWEWRSETYVAKQRGHAHGMRCCAYSPDGVAVATGGEDGAIKLWSSDSGFCYCTLSSHTAPVTAVAFANPSVVLSSSLDGTVRAHDLHRYRNFQTLTSPKPAQFVSLASDPAGEVVTAGTADPFHVYVWSLRTAKLLDVLTGHAGPVCGLAYHPLRGTLASASWDGTVRLWDLYGGSKTETATHGGDVVCVAFRPDGEQFCAGTIRGVLSFWTSEGCSLVSEIDGRMDIKGGRKMNDRMTADNNAASRYFTSVCYTADGSCVLAGGNSKYVCIYEVSQRVLLKKFQISFNRSLDGVLDELNSRNLGDGGPVDYASDDDERNLSMHLPGARRGDDGSRASRVEVLTSQVAFSPTGREWAAVSNEGLHVYSLDDDMIFDPIALTEAVTPGAVQSRLRSGEYGMALRMSLHLNEYALVRRVIEETPHASVPHVARYSGAEHLERLLQFLSKAMADSPHVEFYLLWCLELMKVHGALLERRRGSYMRAFRALHRTISARYDEVKTICDENKYTLDFIEDQAKLLLRS